MLITRKICIAQLGSINFWIPHTRISKCTNFHVSFTICTNFRLIASTINYAFNDAVCEAHIATLKTLANNLATLKQIIVYSQKFSMILVQNL